MFDALRRARGILMGLAILAVVIYHAPFILHNPWVQLIHDMLNCGVDMFLFLSGLGACHSIRSRGGAGYLKQRAIRLLPSLYVFLIPWSLYMLYRGWMTGLDFLGSVTLLGWWLGDPRQLNWYFSAVWMFFLLAIPVYRLHGRTGRPWLTWAGLILLAVAVGYLCPRDYLMTALARLPVFFTGMLFGVLEQRGFRRTGLLAAVWIALIPVGFWCWMMTDWGGGSVYGYRLGTWWYPYHLITPGLAILLARCHQGLSRLPAYPRIIRPLTLCGESSAEILMVHVGLYKIIQAFCAHQRNRTWLLIALGCVALGCGYQLLMTRLLGYRKGRAAG